MSPINYKSVVGTRPTEVIQGSNINFSWITEGLQEVPAGIVKEEAPRSLFKRLFRCSGATRIWSKGRCNGTDIHLDRVVIIRIIISHFIIRRHKEVENVGIRAQA